ncbi:MAG: hypothetical protein EA345_02545 [Halomonas sp.]|nr:MAG: hypothetical protein EA345_02545 [Halomonas sp.]
MAFLRECARTLAAFVVIDVYVNLSFYLATRNSLTPATLGEERAYSIQHGPLDKKRAPNGAQR